ncbi:MAG: hypothetical protein GXO88_07065 [Chlorobi bacterium]|nr:hypothetical protein [Chlorobiota bacterium]
MKTPIKEIIELAKPMSITFHRAFDICLIQELELEKLIQLGVDRVLTSGAANKAVDGVD